MARGAPVVFTGRVVGSNRDVVTGVHETLAALKELDANALRRTNRAINKAADEVAKTARTLVDPQGLSGWQRQLPGGTAGNRRKGYNPAEIAGGIKVKRKRPRRRGPAIQSFVVVQNSTAAGAIWEVAGRKSDGTTPAGRAMVAAIRARGGDASRTVWAAADQTDMAQVRQKIESELKAAAVLVQALINRAGR